MVNCVTALVVIIVAVMLWQQRRYFRMRRDQAQDRQRLLHSGEVFHVVVFFRLKSGTKVIDAARRFAQLLLADSKARLIYAGHAAFTVPSGQLGLRDWDGVLLFEYPSRVAFEQTRNSSGSQQARALFEDSYLHGMRRNRKTSAGVPHYLLRRRIKHILTGKWRIEPLAVSSHFETAAELAPWRARVQRLHALQKINRDGLVVIYLVKYSNAAALGAVDSFGRQLLARMAALTYGPLHLGRSVALEELARFDRVFVVYYPNARYFADLMSSQYFRSFTSSAIVSDTTWVPTAPITERVLT